MAYIKSFFVLLFVLALAGCCALGSAAKKAGDYEQGYRLGVRENIHDFAQNFCGNDFPYFYWQSPVVQNVRIPSHIENGMFVPEHNEPVVIESGEWRKKFGYPVTDLKNQAQETEGGDHYALKYFDFDARDITVFPQSFAGDGSGDEKQDSCR